nr:nuclear pore complex-interacting protein family member B6-like [Pan paniscus]XP_057156023.1 nuclear pore complex-interacting protein family member B6-like [Pan paniscus]
MDMMDPRMYSREPGGPNDVDRKVWLSWSPHSVEMSLPWKGKEQLLFLRFLTFSSPHSHQGLRSICMHTKKRVSSFPGNKIGLKDVITPWRHVERKFRAKIHKRKVTTKINHHDKINGKRKTARKQKMFQRAQELRRRAEDYHKCKIPPSARKPLCNRVSLFVFLAFEHSLPGQDMDTFFSLQLCAQALQREMAERKAAYKHHSPIPVGNRVVQKHLHPHPVGPLI